MKQAECTAADRTHAGQLELVVAKLPQDRPPLLHKRNKGNPNVMKIKICLVAAGRGFKNPINLSSSGHGTSYWRLEVHAGSSPENTCANARQPNLSVLSSYEKGTLW